MAFKKCQRAGCPEEARFTPQLVVWAVDDPERKDDPMRVNLVAVVCQGHKLTLTVEDYLGGLGYQAIGFLLTKETGKTADWASAKMEYMALQNAAMN
jgi:hypothetical protein